MKVAFFVFNLLSYIYIRIKLFVLNLSKLMALWPPPVFIKVLKKQPEHAVGRGLWKRVHYATQLTQHAQMHRSIYFGMQYISQRQHTKLSQMLPQRLRFPNFLVRPNGSTLAAANRFIRTL